MRKWVGHGQGVYTLNEAHHVISMMDPLSAEELAPLTLLLKVRSICHDRPPSACVCCIHRIDQMRAQDVYAVADTTD